MSNKISVPVFIGTVLKPVLQSSKSQEYKKAKDNGFNGSLLEYLNLRDFT